MRTVVECAAATSSRLANRRRPAQQLRQRGDVRSDAPRLVAGEQLRCRLAACLTFEIDLSERLPVAVADAARTGGAPMLMAVEEM